MYIFFYLEMSLKQKMDTNIYAFINVSHIPTKILIEIFQINLDDDPNIMEGYFLTKLNYQKHKKYIDKEIGQISLKKFEYCLRQYGYIDEREVRKFYKLSLME